MHKQALFLQQSQMIKRSEMQKSKQPLLIKREVHKQLSKVDDIIQHVEARIDEQNKIKIQLRMQKALAKRHGVENDILMTGDSQNEHDHVSLSRINKHEYNQLIKVLHLIREENRHEVKMFKEYNTFVYTIACNVPNSHYEEGTINK